MASHDITLRFLAEPTDVNFGGKIFGGSVMKWIDHAGYTCAVNWSHSYCVTVYVDGIQFLRPIRVGDLVELKAQMAYTGNTSMHISVSVHARDPMAGEDRLTTHCILVFVAVDSEGQPISIPAFTPENTEEQKLHQYARKMNDLRKDMRDEHDSFLETMEQTEGHD